MGRSGWTATKFGKPPIRTTGVKSLIGSYGTFLNRPLAAEWVELVVNSSV